MRKAGAHTSTMPEASIYASNEPKSYSWYDLGDCRDSHNKHALRVYYGWIFLRLFIYVMVVSATVRYGTSMSHISLPQTSVSVDSWVVKEKSKNYHNWTSSASYDVCAPAFLIYAVWLWLNLQKMNVCLNQRGEAGRNCALYAQFRPVSSSWFNWIFSITLCRNTDKYKLQAVLHTMWNALEVQSCWLLDFSFAPS